MNELSKLSQFFSSHPLTRDKPFEAWKRFAIWQIRSRLQNEVIVPWIEGQRLVAKRGMTGITGNIYVGLHEFYDMMLPLHFLRGEDLFVDIGANVGSYTMLASGVCGATTWAFEPDPGTARNLKRNIAVNGLRDRVIVHEVALGPSEADVYFTVGKDTVNRVTAEANCTVRVVRQKRLDDLLGDHQPAMIKMDVEGYEDQVLQGCQFVLSRPSLRLIELETVSPGVTEMLSAHGFSGCNYDPFSRTLELTSPQRSSSNVAFVRDFDFVQARLLTARAIAVLGRSI